MSIIEIRLKEKWQEQVAQYQLYGELGFRVALFTVVLSAVMIAFARVFVQWQTTQGNIIVGAAFALYAAVGAWAIIYSPLRQIRPYLLIAVFVLVGIGASIVLTQNALSTQNTFYYLIDLVGIVGVLLIPSWIGLGRLLYRDCHRASFCHIQIDRWPVQVVYGLLAGAFLALQYFLAHFFSTIPLLHLQYVVPILLQRLLLVVGVYAVAEEFLFRGTIFRYLFSQKRFGFWTSTFIMLGLNLLFYIVQIPPSYSPGRIALYLLIPSMLSVTNAVLWSWENGPVSSVASNITLRSIYLLAGWG